MKDKYKLTKNDLHYLKRLMLIYTLEGSKAKNGVYYNKYKNFKGKEKQSWMQFITQ
jgi:hypothetical protein